MEQISSLMDQNKFDDSLKLHPSQSIIPFDKKAKNRYSILNSFFLIFGLVYLPFRILIIIVSMLITWILLKILLIGVKFSDNTWNMQEIPAIGKFRRRLIWIVTYSGLRIMLYGFGVFWISIEGKQHLSKRTKIVAYGPHQTLMDNVVLLAVAPMLSDRTPTGFAAIPEKNQTDFEYFQFCLENVFVDYESQESKRMAAKSSLHRAISEHWEHVVQVFAVEGTTSSGREMLQVKKGAFLSKQPVQPVLLEWPEWIDVITGNLGKARNGERGAGWCGWANDVSLLFLVWYQLTVPFQPVHIKFLPIYEPNDDEKESPVCYAKSICKVLSENGGHDLSYCNQIDANLVNFMSQKYPKIDVKHFRVCGEELEDEFGSKAFNKRTIVKFFEEFIEKSQGAVLYKGQTFKEYVKNKLTENFLA